MCGVVTVDNYDGREGNYQGGGFAITFLEEDFHRRVMAVMTRNVS